MKKAGRLPLYPLLLAAFPVLMVYSKNLQDVTFVDTLRPFVAAIAFGLVTLLIAGAVFRDRVKAGIGASIVILVLTSFGYLLKIASKIALVFGLHLSPITPPPAVLWAVSGIVLLLLVLVFRTRRQLHTLAQFVRVMAVIITTMTLVTVGAAKVSAMMGKGNAEGWRKLIQAERTSAKSLHYVGGAQKPDIYYIILDMYPRDDVLKKTFLYDNGRFSSYLAKRGFYVAQDSRCNYYATKWSLPSALNYEYLDKLQSAAKCSETEMAAQSISNNRICRVLRDQGYRYALLYSGWAVTSGSKYTDVALPAGGSPLTEMERVLIGKSVLHFFSGRYERRNMRTVVLKEFSDLVAISRMKEPTFTFAHIVSPHPPFIFDRHGNVPATEADTFEEQRQCFGDMVEYTNKLTMDTVDKIIANSKVPPIIIIQSDHGSQSPANVDAWMNGGTANLSDAEMLVAFQDRSPILNAYYFPGTKNKGLYPSIHPANSFRVLLNNYFGANYKMLPDTTYVPGGGTWERNATMDRLQVEPPPAARSKR